MNTIYEILEKANNYKQEQRRINYLKDNNDKIVRTILYGNFSSNLNLKMPAGSPPYTPNENAVHEEKEYNRISGMLNFNEHQWAREKRFIQLLEAVPSKDAEILVAMKDKTLTKIFPNITIDIVKEVWPSLIK